MSTQNFFYLTTSSAIILLTVFFIILIVIGIIITIRIAKIFKTLYQASENINETTRKIKEKIKISALASLLLEGFKEFINILKEKKEKKPSSNSRKKIEKK